MNQIDKIDVLYLAQSPLDCARRINARNVAMREAEAPKGRGVFARMDFLSGDVVVHGIIASLEPRRTNFTIQLFWNVHANFEEPGIVINHSCAPNVGVVPNRNGAYDFVALREIREGEEICFDYATTEYESIAVAECSCGAGGCRGASGGFALLDPDHPLIESQFVAPYLLAGQPSLHEVVSANAAFLVNSNLDRFENGHARLR